MDNQLAVPGKDQSIEEFLLKLNQATGFSGGMPTFPILKFDGQDGVWKEETPEKDPDGKPIYKEIGEAIEMHIITTRKMVQSSFSSEQKLYSREFQDNYVEIFDETGKVVLKGLYKALKNANPDLVFVQVIYAFVGDKPYRVKFSGSKLTTLFPYLSSFKNDNPARWMTGAAKGQQLQKGAVKYYEIVFTRGENIEDINLIVKRVNDINQYLNLYIEARDSRARTVTPQVDEQPPMIDEPIIEGDDLPDVSNVQF